MSDDHSNVSLTDQSLAVSSHHLFNQLSFIGSSTEAIQLSQPSYQDKKCWQLHSHLYLLEATYHIRQEVEGMVEKLQARR